MMPQMMMMMMMNRVQTLMAGFLTLQGRKTTFLIKIRMSKIIDYLDSIETHNIGTHLKGIETSFHVEPLFLKSFHFCVNYITFCNFLEIPSIFKVFTWKRHKLDV
jgi:hypothetical protein